MIWFYENYEGIVTDHIPILEFFYSKPNSNILVGPQKATIDTGADITVFPVSQVPRTIYEKAPIAGRPMRVNGEVLRPVFLDIYLLFHEIDKAVFEQFLENCDAKNESLAAELFQLDLERNRYILDLAADDAKKAQLVKIIEEENHPLSTLRAQVAVAFSSIADEFLIGRNLLNIDKALFNGPANYAELSRSVES